MTVEHVSPAEAYELLRSKNGAQLVDVRTTAEWSFVGIPDLTELGKDTVLVEWRAFPHMGPNTQFADQLLERVDHNGLDHLLFICRSGARSHEAAVMMTRVFSDAGRQVTCINVAEGFEGDLNPARHRGEMNGWKAHGLPWLQS